MKYLLSPKFDDSFLSGAEPKPNPIKLLCITEAADFNFFKTFRFVFVVADEFSISSSTIHQRNS